MTADRSDSTPLSRSFVHVMIAVLVFSLWLTVSPYLIPEAIPTTLHLVLGGVLSGLAVLFLYIGLSQPVTEFGSVWYITLLAVLVLVGALANLPRDNLLFWSDLLASGGILILTLYTLYLTSDFVERGDQSTADKETDGN